MPQTAVDPLFLHVFNVESGQWESWTLDPLGSPRIVEAMNLICAADGIRAYIGTRSELGQLLAALNKYPVEDMERCWTSLPASTVMSKLGLYQNTLLPDRRNLVCHGNPLVILLSLHLLDLGRFGSRHILKRVSKGWYRINWKIIPLEQFRLPCLLTHVSENEKDELENYLDLWDVLTYGYSDQGSRWFMPVGEEQFMLDFCPPYSVGLA